MNGWRTLVVGALAALVAVAPAGCGSSDPAPEPAPAPLGVQYTRTGGYPQQVGERLVIPPSGRATLTVAPAKPKRVNVPLGALRVVQRDLDRARFTDLETNQRTIPEPDGFNYTIRYRGHLVNRESAGLEPELAKAIRRLDEMVAAYR